MKAKILFVDIETSPIMAAVWSLYQEGVVWQESDWHMMSWAAKWQGERGVRYKDQRAARDPSNDKAILKPLWKLLDQADIVVGHNIDKFDRKKINARFIMQGMQPPSSYKTIDTLKIARKHFGFTSNRLEYLAKTLGMHEKSKHAKYPGYKLWEACLKGDQKAWKEMERYNKMDVVTLEEVYRKLLPWESTVDFSVYGGDKPTCGCGSASFMKNGYAYTPAGRYQRYRCTQCGSELRGAKNLNKGKDTLRKVSKT